MITRFYIVAVCLVADIILSAILVTAYLTFHDTLTLWIGLALALLYVVEIVAMCLFWHRAWRTIQDPHARTTPGKAIGLMFIPVFNFYWAFVLIWGFAKDYNAYCRRHAMESPPRRLPSRFFLAVVIMWIGLVVLRYGSAVGVMFGRGAIFGYAPVINSVYGICFSLAMLVLLYKTARAVTALR